VGPTDAYGISCPVSGYRGVVALRESGGQALLIEDDRMKAAQTELARNGLWTELSGACGLAGLRGVAADISGPVVCVATSSGFKDKSVGVPVADPVAPEWDAVRRRLRAAGIRD
jgi:threonine synthase